MRLKNNKMKQVSIREAQVHLTTLLRELPVEITRRGKPVAILSSVDEDTVKNKQLKEDLTVIEKDPIVQVQEVKEAAETITAKKSGNCEAPNQRCFLPAAGQYRITLYDPDKGEIKKELDLCTKHYQKALKEGAEIEYLSE
jgi:antitoxin (DNA-binding transcriptional repressor) of toxin-antitoxin stability system